MNLIENPLNPPPVHICRGLVMFFLSDDDNNGSYCDPVHTGTRTCNGARARCLFEMITWIMIIWSRPGPDRAIRTPSGHEKRVWTRAGVHSNRRHWLAVDELLSVFVLPARSAISFYSFITIVIQRRRWLTKKTRFFSFKYAVNGQSAVARDTGVKLKPTPLVCLLS